MQPIQLFELTTKQAHWLTVRQTVVAGNIAKANTPGYLAQDVTPFSAVLQQTNTRMAATQAGHFSEDAVASSTTDARRADGFQISPSGNSVSLPDEMAKTAEIKRQYELNTSLVKSFHKMMLLTVRR